MLEVYDVEDSDFYILYWTNAPEEISNWQTLEAIFVYCGLIGTFND